MARFRFIIVIIDYVLFLIMLVSGVVFSIQLKVPFNEIGTLSIYWDESRAGYYAHGIGGIAENVMILMSGLFYASFVTEFKRIRSKNGRLEYKFIE